MKTAKIIFLLSITIMVSLFMCSCMRNSSGKIDKAINRGENAIDRGIGSVGDGIENSMDIVTGDRFGANSGYSGGVGNGTNTSLPYSGRPMELLPTLTDKSRDNMGQINTTNGNKDGGNGDMFNDMDRRRNSLSIDRFSK